MLFTIPFKKFEIYDYSKKPNIITFDQRRMNSLY